MKDIKHPEIEVQLAGEDGNAYAILSRVTRAMRKAGLSREEINDYMDEAMSGDYDNLIAVTTQWITAL